MNVFTSTQKSSFVQFSLSLFIISLLTFSTATQLACKAQETRRGTAAIPPLPSSEEHLRLAALLGPHAYLPSRAEPSEDASAREPQQKIGVQKSPKNSNESRETGHPSILSTQNPTHRHRDTPTPKLSRGDITAHVAFGFRLLRESQIWWVINAEPSELMEASPSDQLVAPSQQLNHSAIASHPAPKNPSLVPDIQTLSPLPVQLIEAEASKKYADATDIARSASKNKAPVHNRMVGSGPIIVYIEETYHAYDLSTKDRVAYGKQFKDDGKPQAETVLAVNSIRLHAPQPATGDFVMTDPQMMTERLIPNIKTSQRAVLEPQLSVKDSFSSPETAVTAVDNADTLQPEPKSLTPSVALRDTPRKSQNSDTINTNQVWDDFDQLLVPTPAITIAEVRSIDDSETDNHEFITQPQDTSVSFATRQFGRALATIGKIESFAQQEIRGEMTNQLTAFQKRWEQRKNENLEVRKGWTRPSDAGLALLMRAGAIDPNLAQTGQGIASPKNAVTDGEDFSNHNHHAVATQPPSPQASETETR